MLATVLYRAAHYSAQRGSILVLMLLAHLWQICLKKQRKSAVFPAAAGRQRGRQWRLWQDLMWCQRGRRGKFKLQKQKLRTWHSVNLTHAAAMLLPEPMLCPKTSIHIPAWSYFTSHSSYLLNVIQGLTMMMLCKSEILKEEIQASAEDDSSLIHLLRIYNQSNV